MSVSVCSSAEPALNASTVEVAFSHALSTWRYFSVIRGNTMGNTSMKEPLVLVFLSGQGVFTLESRPHAFIGEGWAAALTSHDGGASFEGEPVLVVPDVWDYRSSGLNGRNFTVQHMTSNLAMLRVPKEGSASAATDGDDFVAVGGLFRRPLTMSGLMLARGSTYHFAPENLPPMRVQPHGSPANRVTVSSPSQWTLRHLMDGRHPGCVEARRLPSKLRHKADGSTACEFDGRVSLARLRGAYHLYVRLNPVQEGQRFVQTCRSTDLVHWDGFRAITIDGLGASERKQLNLYNFLVDTHPSLPDALVALVPTVHRGEACVGVSLSRDGINWTRIAPVAACAVDLPDMSIDAPHDLLRTYRGERSTAQPAAGVLRLGATVIFFVHENVAGIANAVRATRSSRPALRRFSIPVERFHEWSEHALSLCGVCQGPTVGSNLA